MPEKKKISSSGKDTKVKAVNLRAATIKEEGNFLVVSCPNTGITSDMKFSVKKVAKTFDEAESFIKNLTNTRPEYLCIVEKKGLYERKPQIVLTKID